MLRAQGSSLDQIISDFLICCRQQDIRWTGIKLAAALDKAAEARLFVPLFESYEQSTHLPDYQTTLEQLGIRIDGKQIILSGDPSLAEIRRAISAPR
jgi:hypothetical protein